MLYHLLCAALLVAGVARAQQEEEVDQRVRMQALEEMVEELERKSSELSKVRVDGFVDLRFDDERKPASNTGLSGIYARRAEFKFHGKLLPNVKYALGFDFTELKHKDLGIEVEDLQLIPFLDWTPEWTYKLRLGQFRQPFGIVPQTSSSSILFAERPIIFGGKNQVGGTKLVGERVMGAQILHKKKLIPGVLSWTVQGGGFNNAEEDQAAGKNKIGASDAFPKQAKDQDLSWIARVQLGLDALAGLLPEKSKVLVGGSYTRDSQNTVWMAQGANAKFAEVLGADVVLGLGRQVLLQGEYVRMLKDNNNAGSADGWYVDLAVDVLPWLVESAAKGDKLELLLRRDEQNDYAAGTGRHVAQKSRLAGGLKWSYAGGKNHTAINYYVDAPYEQFMSAPATMIVVQQQFAFEN